MLWYLAIGRKDLALESFAAHARKLPHIARKLVFDSHFEALRCEPGYRDILAALKVDAMTAASQCGAGA